MKRYRVPPDSTLLLKHSDPGETGAYRKEDRPEVEAETAKLLKKLSKLQERLYAGSSQALLIVLQGMDTSGKDGTIKHVMSGVNPQGCRVSSFKSPTPIERDHDFLWRIHQQTPPRGMIGIFNRSHYEDVLITRVHGYISNDIAESRFKQINDFEKLLVKNGTRIIKLFLHISKEEQRERLLARIEDPEKRWKFNRQDLEERKLWGNYRKAYEEAISATSTKHAPWYIVPADHKWYRNYVVAHEIVAALEDMNLKTPKPPPGINFKTLKFK